MRMTIVSAPTIKRKLKSLLKSIITNNGQWNAQQRALAIFAENIN